MSDFWKDLETGKTGEAVVTEILEQEGYEVHDLTHDATWMRKDCDLMTVDGVTYEVKTDGGVGKAPHNILVEDYKVHLEGHDFPGWLSTEQKEAIMNGCKSRQCKR